jgi:hypothetical protein
VVLCVHVIVWQFCRVLFVLSGCLVCVVWWRAFWLGYWHGPAGNNMFAWPAAITPEFLQLQLVPCLCADFEPSTT